MKTFWSIIAVLTLATLAVWFTRPKAAVPTRPTPAPTQTAVETPRAEVATPKVDTPEAKPDAAASAAPAAPSAATTEASAEVAAPAPATAHAPGAHNAYHSGAGAPPGGEIVPKQSGAGAPTSPPSSSTPPPSAVKPEAAGAEKPDGGAAASGESAAKFTLGPATEVKEEPDGWTRLDGRFLVRGAGTEKDPMLVPWELLVSASETYRPRTGLKEMPRRVSDLKGKRVKLTGYALFPLISSETTELLLMRNQWDGCCIGVPPTPYDAVEVKLAKPAERRDTFVSYVTIEGVIDVDPYVNRDFLLGLYVLSEGALVQPAKDKDAADKGL